MPSLQSVLQASALCTLAVTVAHGHETDAMPMQAVALAADDDVSISAITLLSVLMYGSIGAPWFIFLALPRDNTHIELLRVGLLCVSWSSMSIGMHVLNKSLASSLQAPALISIAQMGIAAIAMTATSCGKLFLVPSNQLRMWLFVPCLFAGMLCSSFYTFEYISLSLLTVVRNLTPLVVLPIERVVMPEGKRPQVNAKVVVAILIMIAGALVYCDGVSVSFIGLAFAGVNMILAVTDRVVQRRLLTEECKDMSSDVCALMSNTLGMLPTVCLAIGTNEVAQAQAGEGAWSDNKVTTLLLISGFIGLGINYLGFETQRAISATSFFVLQNVTKLAVVGMGVFLFGDAINAMTACGIGLSVTGSALYGYAQVKLTEEQRAEQKALLEQGGPAEGNRAAA